MVASVLPGVWCFDCWFGFCGFLLLVIVFWDCCDCISYCVGLLCVLYLFDVLGSGCLVVGFVAWWLAVILVFYASLLGCLG